MGVKQVGVLAAGPRDASFARAIPAPPVCDWFGENGGARDPSSGGLLACQAGSSLTTVSD
jgi:hypothetical protein